MMKRLNQRKTNGLFIYYGKYASPIVIIGICLFFFVNAYLFASETCESTQKQDHQDAAETNSGGKDGKQNVDEHKSKDASSMSPLGPNDKNQKKEAVKAGHEQIYQETKSKPSSDLSPIVLHQMNLTAILSGKNGLAIIDGRCVKVGDRIADYLVSRINTEEVLLEKEGLVYALKMNSGNSINSSIPRQGIKETELVVPDNGLIDRLARDEWTIRLDNIRKKIGENDTLIISQIDGDFDGWDENTIFELTNEQLWQMQFPSSYKRNPLYMPPIAIYNSKDGYIMCIHKVEEEIPVRQIGVKYIGSIDGAFKGWDGYTIFRLNNGEYWQQTSDSAVSAYSSSPKVYVFTDDKGQYCLKVRRIKESIRIRKLLNVIEGRIANYIRNLNDEIIIELDNHQQWIQLEEGFIDICTSRPKVVLYKNQDGEYVMHIEDPDITLPVRRKL